MSVGGEGGDIWNVWKYSCNSQAAYKNTTQEHAPGLGPLFPPEPSLTQKSLNFSLLLLGPHQYGLTASASISFEICGNVTIQDRISDSSHSGRIHGCQEVTGS